MLGVEDGFMIYFIICSIAKKILLKCVFVGWLCDCVIYCLSFNIWYWKGSVSNYVLG